MVKGKLELKKTHDFSATNKPKLVVVFIHGIASDSSTFDHALKYLEGLQSLTDVRFVTFDLLGSGKSLARDDLNYNYNEQIEALHTSIEKLKIDDTPLVLVGHSMGTMIVTRYADTYKKSVGHLILVSPPIYSEKDFENPAFEAGIKLFKDAVAIKDRRILEDKAFNNSMEKIVLNKRNFAVLSEIKTPVVIIFGSLDQFIASYNIPAVMKLNPGVSAIKTESRHGVSRDKYIKIGEVLEGILHA